MPETYQRHRRTADRLIAKYGRDAYLVREGEPGGEPWDPQPGVDELFPIQFVETGYQVGLHTDTLIERGDLLGMMAVPADVTPELSDRLRVDGVDHSLVDLKPIRPGESALAFAFQARR